MNINIIILFLLQSLHTFGIFAAADYECSDDYAGHCYDCFYNDGAICHRALPQTIYKNGVIYTVDNNNSYGGDWTE